MAGDIRVGLCLLIVRIIYFYISWLLGFGTGIHKSLNSADSVLKSSRAISRVNVEQKTNVSVMSPVFIIRVDVLNDHMTVISQTGINISHIWSFATSNLMMETEEMSETLVFSSTLSRLIAREDFSSFIRRESFKSYVMVKMIIQFPTSLIQKEAPAPLSVFVSLAVCGPILSLKA
jgi:hypothetical protein